MSSRRRRGFAASPGPRGFTPASQRELQLPGLLAPGPFETRGQCALPFVRPFTPRSPRALLRPLLTSRSALRRRPFRREARSPQVRPSAFAARPPDLRRTPLVARASRSLARSPWGTSPCIRFLCVSPRFRSPLLSAPPSRSVALRFAPVPATRSREDFHLPVECHAGHNRDRGWRVVTATPLPHHRTCGSASGGSKG